MRTQEQIRARMDEVKDRDVIGFEQEILLNYLDYPLAKEFLNNDCTEQNWAEARKEDKLENTRESILLSMLAYMPFAWEKANNFRGLSAARTMMKYSAWIWLLGDEDKVGDVLTYEFYGKDNLVKICAQYGWDAKLWDDGVRVNAKTEAI